MQWTKLKSSISGEWGQIEIFNIWRLGPVSNTKFDMNISTENLLMLQNARFKAFTVSELLKEN